MLLLCDNANSIFFVDFFMRQYKLSKFYIGDVSKNESDRECAETRSVKDTL